MSLSLDQRLALRQTILSLSPALKEIGHSTPLFLLVLVLLIHKSLPLIRIHRAEVSATEVSIGRNATGTRQVSVLPPLDAE